ncbi:MAG: uridine monophosphate kinase [Eubacteriales bacterium]
MGKRILLKISGEALSKGSDGTFNFDKVREISKVLKECRDLGYQISLVCGAGNIWRGRQAEKKMDRIRADHMGMLATLINALCLRDFLEQEGAPAVVLSAIAMEPEFVEAYTKEKAVRYLEEGKIVIFGGGSSNPCFSTDTAAVLRAAEIEADMILFAKAIDHIYNRDPNDKTSTEPLYKYEYLSYQEILEKGLTAIDITATAFALANNLTINVFGMNDPQSIRRAMAGEVRGTIVHGGESKIVEE